MAEVTALTLNDGVQIPQLGFGVFQIPPDEVVKATRTAIDTGYRLIDTASAYDNEEGVGQAVAECGIPRDELFITTKVWNDDQGYDETLRAFDVSMAKLGLDYLDLYLIHWPRPRLDKYVATWRAFEKLQADGRIRSIGVSNFAPEHIDRLAAECTVVPSVNQVELHPGHPQHDLHAYHAAKGVVTQAWSPIGRNQGLLEHEKVTAIAGSHGKTPAQVVLRWHIQRGIVAIPKSVRPDRIRANIEVFDFELSASEVDVIGHIGTAQKVGPDPALFFDLS
ncbi:aldo/keto reductase [Kibdelosporangium phytohabitans]|uniref:Oxidoreductase n=1 Tax=Kibdelosporangium phytohabitans TaxID=860235 RepID=A0A0N9I344_9PSEU|nr:aldo/keto reductase [Kibdelosporangium phytohabitans]ALG09173.1 oxidoreductase [Kibdelosporangium phytohabitans]MBE1469606.1 diketogulonate reductase-like aldo/keto reductase [Kibdelosporangium phytohabitans]